MSQSLYQKYRPQQLSELVGQEHIRTTLLNELRSGSCAHAYLFSGPRGTGKTTTARLLARGLNCSALRNGEPCLSCTQCRLIQDGKAMDVIEMDAASHTGVDHVRENIIENARVAPSQLPRKVFIIDEVHMLSLSSFNALLKTLEEPPAHVVFILATTELQKVPATIVSRCERFSFRRVQSADLLARLKQLVAREGAAVDDAVLELIARRADGGVRDAESLLGQVLSLAGEPSSNGTPSRVTLESASLVLPQSNADELIAWCEEILGCQLQASITRLHQWVDDGAQLAELMKEWIEFLRRLMLFSVYQSLQVFDAVGMSAQQQEAVKSRLMKNGVSVERIAQMLTVSIHAYEQLKIATIVSLPIELALVELCREAQTVPAAAVTLAAPPAPVIVRKQPNPTTQHITASPPPTSAAPPSTPTSPSTSAPTTSASALTLVQMQQYWPEILKEMKRQNHALHLTFQVGKIVSMENGVLTLGFEYQFYKDRLGDARNLPVIDAVFLKVMQTLIALNILVGSEFAIKGPDDLQNVKNVEQPSEEEVANVWELAEQAFGAQANKAPGSAGAGQT